MAADYRVNLESLILMCDRTIEAAVAIDEPISTVHVDTLRDIRFHLENYKSLKEKYPGPDPVKLKLADQRRELRRMHRNNESIRTATNRRKWYTESELAVIRDENLSAAEVAQKIGRSIKGIRKKRTEIRKVYGTLAASNPGS